MFARARPAPGPLTDPARGRSPLVASLAIDRERASGSDGGAPAKPAHDTLGHDFAKIRVRPDARQGVDGGDRVGVFSGSREAGGEVPHRAAMESAFGEDFSSVRAFTGRRSALDRFGADGAASGERIAFAGDRPSRHLVAHELAHVVQQRRRRPDSGTSHAVHDTASERDAARAASQAARGQQATVSAAPDAALAFSPKNPFDDPKAWSSAAEAKKAIQAYRALPLADRHAAVAASYRKDLVRVLSSLSPVDQTQTFVDTLREIARWVEEEETRASTAMTDDQIAGEQAKFITSKAAAAAQAAADAAAKAKGVASKPATAAEIEKARKAEVESTSIPKSTATWWGSLTPAQKSSWTTRGNAAIAKVVSHAAAKHPQLGITAANFKLDFPGIEARGGGAVAAGSPAQVGKDFVTSAELNPAYVMDVVVHEVFGHPEYAPYGTEYGLQLYDAASKKIAGYKAPAAGSPERTTELDAYAYQETEIYAILRSSAFRTAPTAADKSKVPNLDSQGLVTWHVGLMKKQWSPKLIVGVLRGLRRRLVIDPRITGAALSIFDKAIAANFDAKTAAAILA